VRSHNGFLEGGLALLRHGPPKTKEQIDKERERSISNGAPPSTRSTRLALFVHSNPSLSHRHERGGVLLRQASRGAPLRKR